MRRCLNLVVVATAMSVSVPALADCPPGAWFCAEADVNVPAPPLPRAAPRIPPQAAPAPAEEPEAPAPPPPVRRRVMPPPGAYGAPPGYAPPGYAPPPVVIYQPVPMAPPPQVIVVTPGYGYGYGPYARPRPPTMPAPPPAPRWRSEFGLNLRVEGMGISRPGGGNFSAGLGGVGLSLRYRPVPHFAFDLGVDVLAGKDYNGFQRTEVPVSLSGMLFLNPRSRAQFYLMAGGNVSRAQVHSDQPTNLLPTADGSQYADTFTYIGGQGGGGFEFRLSRRVALDLDAIGFIRKRIDDTGKPAEFTDPQSGRTTNVSGGALFRGGLTFWW